MIAALDWKRATDLVFMESVQRRAAAVAQLLALVLLAATLAAVTWRLVPARDTPAPPPARAAAPGGAEQKWNIAQWHLFGVRPAEVPVGSVESLPETNLNLLLRGVVATSPDGKGGGAIIGVPNGAEDYYALDARLPGGAVLSEVYPDRVVLNRGGRLETLRLPREVLENGPPPDARAEAEAGGDQAPSLRQYRDMLVSNPQQFSDLVKVAPRSEGGRFIGYEIQSGRDQALFDRLGLAPGDVVTSVNGISLDSPAKALGILRTLVGADDVRVDILRNGVPESLVISVQD
jgi:general secretion pathway protein C